MVREGILAPAAKGFSHQRQVFVMP